MEKEALLLRLENTVFLRGENLIVIDRRALPTRVEEIVCHDYEQVAQAIEQMAVQGAGDIAICAGYGLLLAARANANNSRAQKIVALQKAARRLVATRPTGFHLARLIGKMLATIEIDGGDCVAIITDMLQDSLAKQDAISRATGENAARLLNDGDTVLTHCFAGAGLLYMFQYAHQSGKNVKAICAETRPYLQGARLTSFSLAQMGVDTTLITDNMTAHCLARGRAVKVFVAADRIALDGGVANKIGTLALAINANYFGVPFYVLAYGGADKNTVDAQQIPIEERDPLEVLTFAGHPISGAGVKAIYPAFDITPKTLISAYITSKGILSPQDFSYQNFS